LPLLPLFQFPWRMLGPVALLTALAAALAFAELAPRLTPHRRKGLELAVLALCVLNAAPRITEYRPLRPDVRDGLAEGLRPETIRDQGYRATVGDEYLPRGANELAWRNRRPTSGPVVVDGADPVTIDVQRDDPTRGVIRVGTDRPARIEVARWNFPGWRVLVNGEHADATTNRYGSIDVGLPAGGGTVEVAYRPPAVRRISLGISVTALFAWVCVEWRRRRGKPRGTRATDRM
jgi:hypothetical protein